MHLYFRLSIYYIASYISQSPTCMILTALTGIYKWRRITIIIVTVAILNTTTYRPGICTTYPANAHSVSNKLDINAIVPGALNIKLFWFYNNIEFENLFLLMRQTYIISKICSWSYLISKLMMDLSQISDSAIRAATSETKHWNGIFFSEDYSLRTIHCSLLLISWMFLFILLSDHWPVVGQ